MEWPSLAVFKEEGNGRASCDELVLPRPRLNLVSREAREREGNRACNDDGSIPWKNREVLDTRGGVLLQSLGDGETQRQLCVGSGMTTGEKPVDEMRLREMPPYLQDMLLWLYESGGETKGDSWEKSDGKDRSEGVEKH